MREALLAALAAREETITVGGKVVLVRELDSAADVAAFLDNADLSWKLVVRCTLDPQTQQPIWTDDDIPALKKTGRNRMAALIEAVNRVNGTDGDAVKNSGAGPGAG